MIVARSAGEGWHATPGDFSPGTPAGRVLLDRVFAGDPATLDRVLDRLLGLDEAEDLSDELPPDDPAWRLLQSKATEHDAPPSSVVIAARVGWHQRLQALGFAAKSELSERVPIPPADPGPASGMLPTRTGMPLLVRALEYAAEHHPEATQSIIEDIVQIHNHVLLQDPDALANPDDPHDGLHPIDGLINLGLEHTATALGDAASELCRPEGLKLCIDLAQVSPHR